MKKIELGMKCKDIITGFEGIAIAKTEWLTGCTRFGLQPPVDKDGKVPEAVWFDETAMTIVSEKRVCVEPEAAKKPKAKLGGPRPNPTRATDPR